MEDFKTYCKPAYKCGICGNEFSTVYERANCEIACMKKQQEDERKAIEEKRAAEQKMRKEAVDESIKRTIKLHRDYINDYGYYEYDGELIENLSLPSKLWHYFVF